MIKFINFFIINSILFFTICLCYEVPNVELNLIDKGFSLTLKDEPGLKQVFYIIKINDECPTLMDLLFEPQPDWTTTQTSKVLTSQDKVNISLLVNYRGEAYTSYQYIVIGENTVGIKAAPTLQNNNENCGDTRVAVECEKAQTIVLGMSNLCQGQLIFEDNFDNSQLNMNKWRYDIRHRLIGTDSEEFVVFDNHAENIFIHEGYLNIRPKLTQENMKEAKLNFGSRCTAFANRKKECELIPQPHFIFVPPFNSSQIYTKNTFQFQYGRIEVKAKLPKGEWILPYLMLRNDDALSEKQIHIAFARGNEELLTTDNIDLSGKILYAGLVIDVEKNETHFEQKASKEHFGNDFHIYTLTWKSNEITMEVDGIKYGTITGNLEQLNTSNNFFFITFGVSVGGHIYFPDNLQQPDNKPWSNTSPRSIRDFWRYINSGKLKWSGNETLQIDYVKVYAV
ncbi:gram-negative bacteria-binding protein 2 [Lucilia cuprina]|uniref:gram-negative bacteria-binding protein 2 n=1 Tax=Lucilia cuprina TaxID=7375 RepID=UPI001F052317|nr:gram-negative bacteria-binding protein 2 [Lucilia cuprina]